MNFSVNLHDHTAIVTGAAAGVGRAAALALAQAGANVTLFDINPDRVESAAQEIIALGGSALGIQGDVTNRFQVGAMIEETRNRFGRIHILVNAAGVFKHNDAFNKLDEWDWRRQLDTNLTGTFFCTQLISRVMADEGGGTIVNVAASAWNHTLPHGAGYIASKAGLIGLTHQSARELAPSGIRVNAICPANLDDAAMPDASPNMFNRTGTPEEVAHAILFLCSDAARFITGQALHVDGGSL